MITKKPVLRLISLVMSVLLLISFNSLAFRLLFLLPKKILQQEIRLQKTLKTIKAV